MSARKLSNIPVKDFRKFPESQGLNIIKDTKGRGGMRNGQKAAWTDQLPCKHILILFLSSL